MLSICVYIFPHLFTFNLRYLKTENPDSGFYIQFDKLCLLIRISRSLNTTNLYLIRWRTIFVICFQLHLYIFILDFVLDICNFI